MVTQSDIARKLGIDVSSVNKILNRRKTGFKPETVRRVFRVAKALGFRFERLKYIHRRRFERKRVQLEADLLIFGADGSEIDRGRCIIDDIAVCGASLVRVELRNSCLPLRQVTLSLRLQLKQNKTLELRGVVVRLREDGDVMKLGVAFLNPNPALGRLLQRLS